MASLGSIAGSGVSNAQFSTAGFARQRVSFKASSSASALRTGGEERIIRDSRPLEFDRRTLLSSVLLMPLLGNVSVATASPIKKGAKVFVAGATGNTGQRVVRQLSEQGFTVLAGTRDNKKAEKLFGDDNSIQLVNFNLFDTESIAKAISGADAVVSALGYSGFNPGGFKDVDLTGNVNLIEAAKRAGVSKFVLLTSLLTNAKAAGQGDNPNYKFLNLFGGVLDNKLEAEKALRASGLEWTIVRPGGLSNETPENIGNIYVSKEDTLFGRDEDPGRSISRDSVASVMVEALQQSAAEGKVVEIVAGKNLPKLSKDKWFKI